MKVSPVLIAAVLSLMPTAAPAAESLTVAGPAMGTTYRVTLASPVARYSLGEIHREVDQLLARLDRQLSTWRNDSDVTRLNRAAAGVWIDVGPDLVALLTISAELTRKTDGRFDVTVAPLIRWWKMAETQPAAPAPPTDLRNAVGIGLLKWRTATDGRSAAVWKCRDDVEVDFGGIGPGYAVDRIGEALVALGSAGHLVELGGEVRAWGCPAAGRPWRVAVAASAGSTQPALIELADGEAVAVFAAATRQTIIDPRTISPMDWDAIFSSVEKTGRLVVVDESQDRCGMAADIAGQVAQNVFGALKSAPQMVTPPFVPVPFAANLEAAYIPDAKKIEAAVRKTM